MTAYTRYDEGCTDYTDCGTRGLIAVDPSVIPLGIKLSFPAAAKRWPNDIGAIRGNHIDLAMDTLDEAFAWGVRNITIYVLPNSCPFRGLLPAKTVAGNCRLAYNRSIIGIDSAFVRDSDK
ncbi:MAG TPA: 3D domain-containing protein [Selenomonadales bacterium]|nr:3D domain-containing protein [Selenomonadales bacterium]